VPEINPNDTSSRLRIRATSIALPHRKETQPVKHPHRSGDADASDFQHQRIAEDSGLRAVVTILGMPVSMIAAVVTLILALFGVWLTHDRAIASNQATAEATKVRVDNIEKREEKRTEQEAIVAAALARIETKLDDVKDRVARVENNQPPRH
jgi:hypothetical protein